jgi:hypothetical protein
MSVLSVHPVRRVVCVAWQLHEYTEELERISLFEF